MILIYADVFVTQSVNQESPNKDCDTNILLHFAFWLQ